MFQMFRGVVFDEGSKCRDALFDKRRGDDIVNSDSQP